MARFLYCRCRLLAVIAVVCFCCSCQKYNGTSTVGSACTDGTPVIKCKKIVEPMVIDARGNESSWKDAQVVELVNNDGTETGKRPRLGTEVRLLYDENYLYAMFTCEDDNIRVDYHDHDDPLWNSYPSLELVELMLDPAGQGKRYFEINVNPEGVVLDVLIKWVQGAPTFDVNWDVKGLQVGQRLLSKEKDGIDGWAVEMAIPWSPLEWSMPKGGETWKANLYRGDGGLKLPRLSWSATGTRSYHVPKKFGTIVFEKK